MTAFTPDELGWVTVDCIEGDETEPTFLFEARESLIDWLDENEPISELNVTDFDLVPEEELES